MSIGTAGEAAAPVPTALILTALPKELVAVLKLLGPRETVVEAGYHFYVSSHAGWRIVAAQSGKLAAAAVDLTGFSIRHFKPEAALFVGIAGRRKDVALGDVVIGERLSNYDIGKETPEGFIHRSHELPASHRLVQIAKKLELNCLLSELPAGLPEGTKVVVGHITSGNTTLATAAGAKAQMLDAHFDDAIAVEQEGHPFLSAASKCEAVPAIVVRGVSDMCTGKAEADALGWQEIAAHHAAVVALAILSEFPIPKPAAGLPAAPRTSELADVGGDNCALSGALAATDITRLWEGAPPVDVLRLRLDDSTASLPLRHAVLRVLCHVSEGSSLAVEVAPGSGWQGRYAELVDRPKRASFTTWRPVTWREASAPAATQPGDVVTMTDMAETLHAAMDAWCFATLDTKVREILTRAPGMVHCITVEEALGDELLGLWSAWQRNMDEPTRARFMSLLVTLHDSPLPRDVAIGPRMIDGMAAGAVLALALAHCGGFAASLAGRPGLYPCADTPGNLAAESLRCHSSGVERWGKTLVGHLRISDLEDVKARLLLLARHTGPFPLAEATERPLGAAHVSTSLNSNELSLPAILTYDGDFARALEGGKEPVERYLRERLERESLRGQAILEALDKSA